MQDSPNENEPQTFLLYADVAKSGRIVHEELPVDKLSGDTMRVLASPGLVQGIARGDVLRIVDDDHRFEVVSRAGNVAVQMFCQDGLTKLDAMENLLSSEGLGQIDGATDQLIVLTFPVSATFSKIEMVTKNAAERISADGWQYGNVYADDDGNEPLNWWLNSQSSR